jgi:putative Ca2+/H+ antiporter (TMEM165/GDT1 family)
MFEDFIIPLIVIGLAEFGDKTQISLLVLSSKFENRANLLLGTMLAFFVVDGIAILFGEWIISIVPILYIKIVSGIIFIIFGILILLNKEDEEAENKNKYYFKNPLMVSFSLIFLTEWGDKTQIAAALFATQYNGILVLAGVLVALALLSIMAIYLGKIISDKIDNILISKVAGIVFIIIGLTFFFL